jgi:iron uptake system component EfeO
VVVGVAGLVTAACSSGSVARSASDGGGAGQATTVEVVLTNDGCALPSATVPAGAYTFHVTNDDASSVSEFEILQADSILGEKENLAPGLDGSFSLSLTPGSYRTYCPGAATDTTPFTVTGAGGAAPTSAVAAELAAATDGYATYVKGQAAELTKATAAFVTALQAGNLAKARLLYAPARVSYERIEPVAESFGDLDPEIDAREGDVPASQWTGFHALEKVLWVGRTTKGTDALAAKLLADVQRLQAKVQTATYQPAQLANGATELLGEVARSKLTGEEERYSRTDLVDVAANVDGSKQAFVLLLPALAKVDPALGSMISERFGALETLLARYRSGDGFVAYTALGATDVKELAVAVDALAEPLSTVAAKVVAG